MMIDIVDGGAADLDGVMDVMGGAFGDRYGEAWTRSQCAGILPMKGVKLMLARDGSGEVLGFALYRAIIDDSELLLLAVAPKAQRNGVGRRLLEKFIEQSRQQGAAKIHLEVRDGNPAIQLYESAGFQQANRRKNYYRGRGGGQFDALTFLLQQQ